MKLWHSMVALSAVLTPFMAEAAFSQPLNSEFPRVSNPEVYVPICYIETTSGTTLDLRTLCGSNSTSTRTAPASNNGNNPDNKTNPRNPGTNPTNDPNTGERISLPTTNNEGRNTGGNPGTGNMGNPTSGNPNSSQSPANGNDTNDSVDFPDNTGINLPRVPSSAFGPGGTAPTRDSINGPQNQQ